VVRASPAELSGQAGSFIPSEVDAVIDRVAMYSKVDQKSTRISLLLAGRMKPIAIEGAASR
jgi:hypothetical protein